MKACRVCGGREGARYLLHEFMFRTDDEFCYFECQDCGCLQIEEIPPDLGRFYPAVYYSLKGDPPALRKRSLRRRLVDLWAHERRGGPIAAALYAHKPNLELRQLGELGIRKTDAILDIGSGRGDRIARLQHSGFGRAIGIDPFLDRDVVAGGRVVARRATMEEVQGRFRLVTFHHTLEHMPDQHSALEHARRLVADDGFVLVRIPTVSSDAWRTYREAWAQLDPPRHLYLHSRESLRRLAQAHGLRVLSETDDSTAFQFWGSAQVQRGIPLANGSGEIRPSAAFERRDLEQFERRAKKLNRHGCGDQIAVVLVPQGAG